MNQESRECKKKLFQAIKRKDPGRHLEIGKHLYHALTQVTREGPGAPRKTFIRTWGYENLGDLARKEIGISYRTAMTWVEIWKSVLIYHLNEKRIEQIPRSKMSLIVPALDEFNSEDLLRLAETKSVEEIRSYVNILKGRKSPEFIELSIPKVPTNSITRAISLVSAATGDRNPLDALDYICRYFIASDPFSKLGL
jgi:hypothetical protein